MLLTNSFGELAKAQETIWLPPINVTATRLSNGITGASTTVLTAQDIERSPARTVQEVLATIPGVQIRSLYGGVNGAGTSVDLRGFGAFATANTLVLVNGRRLNDLDLAGVDLSTIPRESIERIEVTRGNSGAVLYGDNAVGGVVNIITKTALAKPFAMRAEGGVGSFNQREGNVSASVVSGPFSATAFGNAFTSDGYRQNNQLTQYNGIGEVRYTTPDFSAFFNLSGDDQRLGLPGARRVTPAINELVTDRRGAATPFDYAEKQGLNATAGFSARLGEGAELIVDGGIRNKHQQGSFFGNLPLSPFGASFVDSTLQTWSFTPRLKIETPLLGMNSAIVTGIDYYDASYDSSRSQYRNTAPGHVYALNQGSFAAYWQQTVSVLPSTDISYGARIQRTSLTARDAFNPSAPNASGAQATPLDSNETQHALHVGLEHRLNDNLTVFARAARAFRTPNVDERLVTGPAFNPITFAAIPQNFQLKTQTSHDVEAGVRFRAGNLDLQTSVYDMELTNEIHFNPVNFYNYNLDPTRRYGSETSASLRLNDAVRLLGSFSYTRAVFRAGPFEGKDVPLVSRTSGSAGLSWNAWQNYLVVDALVRFWGPRRFDNDQANRQPLIPRNATLDVKLSGEYQNMFWSFAVSNVFDTLYYDYGIASATALGVFNAYPLPGRTFVLKAGVTF